jgi:hypothetical protein
VLLFGGLYLIPPINLKIRTNTNFKPSKILTVGIATVFLFVAVLSSPNSATKSQPAIQKNEAVTVNNSQDSSKPEPTKEETQTMEKTRKEQEQKQTQADFDKTKQEADLKAQKDKQDQEDKAKKEAISAVPKIKTTLDLLWDGLDLITKDRNGFDIKFDEKTKTATLVIDGNKKSYWDDKARIESIMSYMVDFGGVSFTTDKVEKFVLQYKLDMVDTYGNSLPDKVVFQVLITKLNYLKFDFKNLKSTPIYYKLMDETDPYEMIVSAALIKNVNLNEVKLRSSIYKKL